MPSPQIFDLIQYISSKIRTELPKTYLSNKIYLLFFIL